METPTEKKIVEILTEYNTSLNYDDGDNIHGIPFHVFKDIASEIAPMIDKLKERLDIQINVNDKLLLELKEANKQLAKYKELVEAQKDSILMLYDIIDELDPESIVLTDDLEMQELRQKIEQLKSEIK